MRRRYPLVIISILLISCSKLSPAGFWNGFDSDHIIKNSSDQGLWGGRRSITWENKAGIYNEKDVISFAKSNGWKLLDQIIIDTVNNKNISIKNNNNKKPEEAELATYGGNTEGNLEFSGCVNNGCTLYTFNSGWTWVTEGQTVAAEGYLLISADKTRMNVFHSWGE